MKIKILCRASGALMLAFIVGIIVMQPASAIPPSSIDWISPVDGGDWSNGANWSSGFALANGEIPVFYSTMLESDLNLNINNDISPHLALNGMVFTGSGDNGVTLNGEGVRISGDITDDNSGYASDDVNINIGANSTLRVITSGQANITFSGDFFMGPYNLGLRSYDSSIIYIDGYVDGTTGSVYISGGGPTFLTGNAVIKRPVQVKDSGFLVGTGVTGSLTITSTGVLYPIFDCMTTKSLTIDGWLYASIGGATACSGYGRINAHGIVDVSGGTLATKNSLSPSYTPAKGSKYILISNDGIDAVVGIFNNRPEGSIFKIGIYTFKISYKGGSGNDVVLTRL